MSGPLYTRTQLWGGGDCPDLSSDRVLASILALNSVQERVVALAAMPAGRRDRVKQLLVENGVEVDLPAEPAPAEKAVDSPAAPTLLERVKLARYKDPVVQLLHRLVRDHLPAGTLSIAVHDAMLDAMHGTPSWAMEDALGDVAARLAAKLRSCGAKS